ncbi:hypothetical protein ACTMTI_27960 [Nonomuraea sp. H19]|uniref:hypothetical protein n=1 Tax=Nonomuraea sp. H19 TaxID=3452206 RepID=UPI003F891208
MTIRTRLVDAKSWDYLTTVLPDRRGEDRPRPDVAIEGAFSGGRMDGACGVGGQRDLRCAQCRVDPSAIWLSEPVPMAMGTLKIVFTPEDLARVRIASHPDLMWEMVLSLHLLQARGGGTAMAAWRRQVRDNLAEIGLLPQTRNVLIPLAPSGPYFPDFLTPEEAQMGLDRGVEALAATPRRRIRHELDLLQTYYGLPPGLEDLARGDPRAPTSSSAHAA